MSIGVQHFHLKTEDSQKSHDGWTPVVQLGSGSFERVLLMTSVIAYQFDSTKTINYIGNDPEYYPDSGPVVLPELQTPRVSGYDLDALELVSHGKLVFTTQGTSKALEVSAIGESNPAVIDTTVLDSGTKKLKFKSDVGTSFDSDNIFFSSSGDYYSTIGIPDPADPTFHHYASSTRQSIGIGVVDVDKKFVSGGWLDTTATSFNLRNDNSSIMSETGADSRIEYRATVGHDFYVGSDAATQGVGTAAVEMRDDKIIIRRDVELLGSLDSTETTSSNLHVEDQIIRLAYTSDPATANRDSLLAASKTGITVETVPGSYADDGAYMSRFVDDTNAKIFVDDSNQTIDVPKALASGLFTKELAYYLNSGAKTSGARTTTSRLREPAWQVTGGALHLSHTVPNGNGKALKYSMGFRITDDGTMEIVRLTHNLLWQEEIEKYIADAGIPDTSNVLTRYVNPKTR